MSLEHNDVLVLSVLVSRDIDGSTVLDVDDCSILILEKLEPSGISLPDLEVGGSTRVLDVK
jgi:hypothetical protein